MATVFLKNKEEIKVMREGGKILAQVAKAVAAAAKIGISLEELDKVAEKLMKKAGGQPAFLGYRSQGATKGYPASICTSVNDIIVHGLPTERKLKEGDVLKVDFGVLYKGYYTDTALTIGVGEVTPLAYKLIKVTKEALDLAIRQCRIGKTLGDIGWTISNHAAKNGFKLAKGLTGHGIGRNLHEDPVVFNFGKKGMGLKLMEGMAIAVEPMLCAGSGDIIQLADESYATKDGSLSAHFEHTVAITKRGPLVLTQ